MWEKYFTRSFFRREPTNEVDARIRNGRKGSQISTLAVTSVSLLSCQASTCFPRVRRCLAFDPLQPKYNPRERLRVLRVALPTQSSLCKIAIFVYRLCPRQRSARSSESYAALAVPHFGFIRGHHFLGSSLCIFISFTVSPRFRRRAFHHKLRRVVDLSEFS